MPRSYTRLFARLLIVLSFTGCSKDDSDTTSPRADKEKPAGERKSATRSDSPSAAAEELKLTGRWKTAFNGSIDQLGKSGGGLVVVTLTQIGDKVLGQYKSPKRGTKVPPGTMEGKIRGRTLTGTWVDKAGARGPFSWVFDASGDRFKGTWRSRTLSGKWVGARMP